MHPKPTRSNRSVGRAFLPLVALLFMLGTPDTKAIGQRDDAGRLQVSPDHRHLIRRDGTPFFWLGDTAWELFHRLDREDADLYLEDRARKGFTVIQAVVLAELEGLTVPNPYGDLPLVDQDPRRPNESYFEHVDYIVDRAETLGLFVGMLPTWGDKWNRKWGVGPEVFTPENARAYGRFLGARYRDEPIVWILGGDRNPETEEDLAIIRAMAEGLREGDGGVHLMTFHPQGGSASYDFFDDAWLDFHMIQSGHGARDIANYAMVDRGSALTPVRPVLDGEPRYEDHPVDWNPDYGWFGDFDVRQAAYWSVLSGAFGHTYGDHNIWQMWHPDRLPVSAARTPWREALAHAGATQMGFMRRLFLSRPFLALRPDQDLLAGGSAAAHRRAAPGAHVRAGRGADGSYAIVYTPYGYPVTLDLRRLSADRVVAYWFDPRTGAATRIGTFAKAGTEKGEVTFDPPGQAARGNDWVLVLDDADQDFAPPGCLDCDAPVAGGTPPSADRGMRCPGALAAGPPPAIMRESGTGTESAARSALPRSPSYTNAIERRSAVGVLPGRPWPERGRARGLRDPGRAVVSRPSLRKVMPCGVKARFQVDPLS